MPNNAALSATFEFGAPATDADRDRLAEILGACFCVPTEIARREMDHVERENILLIRRSREIIGGLYLLPMGQWFGGKSVPTTGIAAVGIAPEHRGCGAARALMTEALRETRRRGIPLSTLYPATLTLYRSCGYEVAGSYYTVAIDPAGVAPGDRALTVRPANQADLPAIQDLYRLHASERNGWLDRGPYIWRGITEPRDGTPYVKLVQRGDQLVGYCCYLLEGDDAHGQTMRITDMVATSTSAAQRLLTFLADHRSLVRKVVCHRPINDPLLMLLPERCFTATAEVDWMIRLVDVPAALARRGYPPAVSAEVHFDVADDLFPENASRYVLSVRDGAGRVEPGGAGHVRCGVRGLAALYSGFMTAAHLHQAGRIEGDPTQLREASAVFAGDSPGMVDIF